MAHGKSCCCADPGERATLIFQSLIGIAGSSRAKGINFEAHSMPSTACDHRMRVQLKEVERFRDCNNCEDTAARPHLNECGAQQVSPSCGQSEGIMPSQQLTPSSATQSPSVHRTLPRYTRNRPLPCAPILSIRGATYMPIFEGRTNMVRRRSPPVYGVSIQGSQARWKFPQPISHLAHIPQLQKEFRPAICASCPS